MSIYKYVPAERTDILQNGYVCFSRPSALNDPFELRPHFEVLLDEKSASQQLQETFPGLPQIPIAASGIAEYFRELAPYDRQELYAAYDEEVGILCLTKSQENLCMWAHYAQYHEGFVIGFDEAHEFFSKGDEIEGVGNLQEVRYTRHRPTASTPAEFSFVDIVLTKSTAWKYEKEWRMIRRLTDSNKKKGKSHLFKIPPSCIKSVILGCRASTSTQDKISRILERGRRYKHVTLHKMELDEQKYKLRCVPLPKS